MKRGLSTETVRNTVDNFGRSPAGLGAAAVVKKRTAQKHDEGLTARQTERIISPRRTSRRHLSTRESSMHC